MQRTGRLLGGRETKGETEKKAMPERTHRAGSRAAEQSRGTFILHTGRFSASCGLLDNAGQARNHVR